MHGRGHPVGRVFGQDNPKAAAAKPNSIQGVRYDLPVPKLLIGFRDRDRVSVKVSVCPLIATIKNITKG